MQKKIALAVGGTGGHVIPACAFAKTLEEKSNVIMVGVGISKNSFRDWSGPCFDVVGGNFSKGVFRGLKRVLSGFLEARAVLQREKVDQVVGWGSYHSLPVLLAALQLKIPYTLVELNVIPGRVNRLLARWSDKTLIHFSPVSEKIFGKTELIDYQFTNAFEKTSCEEARVHFGLDRDKKTVLIFGGSAGAHAINQCFIDLADELSHEVQVIHFTGNNKEVQKAYEKAGVRAYVKPFSKEIEKAWVAADVVVCRAGAGALREMLIYERPAILIPYPKATDRHQEVNAKFMERSIGGGIHLNQKNLKPKRLLSLLRDVAKHQKCKEALKAENKQTRRPKMAAVIGRNN